MLAPYALALLHQSHSEIISERGAYNEVHEQLRRLTVARG
jgi:hypothetical protein